MVTQSPISPEQKQPVAPGWLLPRLSKVAVVSEENADTVTLTLQYQEQDLADAPQPGQFNMLYAFGVGEIPISVSRIDLAQGQIQHTIRAVGAVSKALSHLKVGDTLGVRGPFGRGWPLDQVQGMDLLVIAGGIGLAPLRPVLDARLAIDHPKAKNLYLLYGARTPADRIFLNDLDDWDASKALDCRVTVDSARSDWTGQVGVVPNLISALSLLPERTAAFICGPELMMHFSALKLIEQSVSAENIYMSMERNMKCAQGHCGHCMLGPDFICKDGPVFSYAYLRDRFRIKEL